MVNLLLSALGLSIMLTNNNGGEHMIAKLYHHNY